MSEQETRRRDYIAYLEGNVAFNHSFMRELGERKKQWMRQYFPPGGGQRLRHGSGYELAIKSEAVVGRPRLHSTEMVTKLEEIVSSDLGLIERHLSEIVDSMHRQFAAMYYATVSEVCDDSGNVVDAQAAGSVENAFLEMLEKIEFMSDAEGRVIMPTMHMSPEMGQQIRRKLESASPEFNERFEAIKAKKTNNALRREAERKSKFACYGES